MNATAKKNTVDTKYLDTVLQKGMNGYTETIEAVILTMAEDDAFDVLKHGHHICYYAVTMDDGNTYYAVLTGKSFGMTLYVSLDSAKADARHNAVSGFISHAVSI